ncbi:tetratricopeptide repeat protein [Rhizohabitans arisaemae]|uniref:tetratricopeptide repeat protein n=1 Tax=Rhizohabitans arisaemae TaxID=2720610 RepID=UPI0024B10E89|nr:tetratricopeptide repeat protein [Rhizohabitans arisaemae]
MTTAPPGPGPEPTIRTGVDRDLTRIAHVAGNITVASAQPSPSPQDGQTVEGGVPARPTAFQLREELLQLLHAQVKAAAVSAVTGTAGVGKTLLVASYAWACRQAGWPVVAWIDAETPDRIVTGLAGLAHRLGLRYGRDDAVTAADKTREWLSARSAAGQPGLLVFDNAAQVDHITEWCPADGAVRVLLVSRNRAFHDRYPALEVNAFTPEQATGFLIGRTGLDDPAGAEALAHELGFLPLALAQAGAFIARRQPTYPAYRRLLADRRTPAVRDTHPAGTAEAVLLSVTQAEDALPDAGRLLRVLAVLSSAGVPVTVLTGGADPGLGDPPPTDPAAAAATQEALAALVATSLIGRTEDGTAVVMHRLIQRVIRERAIHDGDLSTAIDQAIGLLEAFNGRIPDGVHTWAARGAVETLLEQTDALHALTGEAALLERLLILRIWCGVHLTELADLTRAVSLLKETLAELEETLGADHLHVAASRANLAAAYEAAGDPARAIPLYEAALAGCERILGTDHPHTLNCRSNLACAYESAGNPARAASLLEATLAVNERVLGADHLDTLASRGNLARAYQAAGDPARAILLYEATLADCERALGTDHPHTLTCRANLARAYHAAGDPARAILLYEATLADCERVFGTDHPQTLASRGNLARVYHAAGDPARAASLYETALTEREPDHPHTSASRADEATRNPSPAVPRYETALADWERALGTDHPQTVASRADLARAYESAGHPARAVPLHEDILAERERALGTDHPDTLKSRADLARAYESIGDLAHAVPLYETALAGQERVLGTDHLDTLTSRNNLARASRRAADLAGDLFAAAGIAQAHVAAGDLTRAIPMLEEIAADCERLHGADHPDTLKSRGHLARVYESAGYPARAIPLYEATLADCDRILGADHPITKTVRDNLNKSGK